jgi:hypothetical protein
MIHLVISQVPITDRFHNFRNSKGSPAAQNYKWQVISSIGTKQRFRVAVAF